MKSKSPTPTLPAEEIAALRRRLNQAEKRRRKAEEALQALEKRNRLLGDSAPYGIFAIDANGRITGSNHLLEQILPWPSESEAADLNLFEYPPLVKTGLIEDLRRCLAEGQTVLNTRPCTNPQGGCLQLRISLSPLPDENGSVSGVLGFVENITNLKRVEEAFKESEGKYRLLFQSSPVALIERDASRLKSHLEHLQASGIRNFREYLHKNMAEVGNCMAMIRTVDYNEAFLKLMEARDRNHLEQGFLPQDPKELFRLGCEIILMIAEGNIGREREETIVTMKGHRKNVLVKALLVTGHEETYARIVISLVDITQRKQVEEALRDSERNFRELAMRDSLTGLYNQRFLYQALSEWMTAHGHQGTALGLIFMDLDGFKEVVDTHGHLNGSRVIQEVAATIRDGLDEPDYAVAYAGDEFVVVLPGHTSLQALEKATDIQTRIRRAVYLQDQGLTIKVKASLGVAAFPEQAADMTALLAAADHALFAVKAGGGDAVRLADPKAVSVRQ